VTAVGAVTTGDEDELFGATVTFITIFGLPLAACGLLRTEVIGEVISFMPSSLI